MTIRFLAALVSLSFLLAACSTAKPASPVPGSPVPGSTPLAGAPLVAQDIVVTEAGEVVVALRASAPGTSWARQGAEAATVSIHVDGQYKADLVLFRGETPFTYETLLGGLSKGQHRLAVYREAGKSAAQAKEVRVDEVTVRLYSPGDPLYQVMAHAPILYGRDESRYSDVPLFMYHEVTPQPAGTAIQYTIIFSNEDSGTAADGLMARWGRLTDIEWVYRVVLDAAGNVAREEFQDKDHNTALFRGSKEGRHPLLKDVTKNNLFADTGTSPYRFTLVPAEPLPDAAREEMMDRHPWMYRVMAEEWEREAAEWTEKSASPDTRAVSDPRNYLYVEFKSAPSGGAPCDAKLAIQVKLRGSDRWYSSDHGVDSLRIQSQGWRRGTVELPPGTTADQVEALRLAVYPGKNLPNCALVCTDVRKAFFLSQDYVPGPSLLTWHGEQILDAAAGSPYPDQLVLPVR